MIKNLQNIYSYSVLNFIDKGLIFLTPLIILKFFDDKVLYNTIEYVYSISTILVIFFDLGLKNYIFFYLKKSKTYNHDLNNILKFISLRTHDGAQWEIQQLANSMLDIVTEIWPIAVGSYREINSHV